jgi:hypothetical protein
VGGRKTELRDEGTAQLTKTLADVPVAIPVAPLGLTRLDNLPPRALPPVHEDLDVALRLLRREVPPQELQ